MGRRRRRRRQHHTGACLRLLLAHLKPTSSSEALSVGACPTRWACGQRDSLTAPPAGRGALLWIGLNTGCDAGHVNLPAACILAGYGQTVLATGRACVGRLGRNLQSDLDRQRNWCWARWLPGGCLLPLGRTARSMCLKHHPFHPFSLILTWRHTSRPLLLAQRPSLPHWQRSTFPPAPTGAGARPA